MLVLTASVVACRRDRPYQEPEDDGARLGITLEFPSNVPVKATEVPASEDENALTDLQIWVFRSDTKAIVSHLSLDSSNLADDFPQAGSVKRYSMRVDWGFALDRPKVDVFVLANAETVDLNLHANSTYDQVNDAVFGGDFFSPQSKVKVVPDTGLPMAGAAKNLSISGEAPSLSVATISLERTVSKIRFIFSQMLTETDDDAEKEILSIEKIVLNGNMIPKNEYVFGSAHSPRWIDGEDDYVADPVEYEGASNVRSSATPELYKYAGQSGTIYESIIASAKEQQKLTDCGTYYLRESDKAITGTIHFKVTKGKDTPSEEVHTGTANFKLSREGDFARNHTWTVYGYYVSNRTLQLSVNVLPWVKTDYHVDYSKSSLMVTWKLSILDGSYASKIETSKDHYDITLKSNQACSAYLYVATPEGGMLQVIPEGEDGSEDAFAVSFGSNPQEENHYIDINPTRNNGRINIAIDRKEGYEGVSLNKKIQLTFKAYTADGESEIDGASECIDQIYTFILPY